MKTDVILNKATVYGWLEQIPDPEIPVVSIVDLGIVRDVQIHSADDILVKITPTYSGCPAMDIISMQIKSSIKSRGVKKVTVEHQLSPAWTTDWIPESAKKKMLDYGIAPPTTLAGHAGGLFQKRVVPCPHCGSEDTEMVSEFGSTSCKSLYKCLSCKEPFEHFKCY